LAGFAVLGGESSGGSRESSHPHWSSMMITVLLPATLHVNDANRLEIHEPLATIADLVDALDRQSPGFREQLEDSIFNFAVNDEMLLYRAHERALQDGDVVEVIPTISGG
jgi:molybdopterin synthase sulfur carrier subunit